MDEDFKKAFFSRCIIQINQIAGQICETEWKNEAQTDETTITRFQWSSGSIIYLIFQYVGFDFFRRYCWPLGKVFSRLSYWLFSN